MTSRDSSGFTRYVDRGETILRTMRLIHDETNPTAEGDAVVLLAVHASIAMADAIQVAATGTRSRDQDHQSAAAQLRNLCGKNKLDGEGVKHLTWLLKQKTRFSYGEARLSGEDIKLAFSKAERFSSWAYRQFPAIARKESGDA